MEPQTTVSSNSNDDNEMAVAVIRDPILSEPSVRSQFLKQFGKSLIVPHTPFGATLNTTPTIGSLPAGDKRKASYRICLASVPGDRGGQFSSEKIDGTHRKTMEWVQRFLDSLKVDISLVSDGNWSSTKNWGLEPYSCYRIRGEWQEVRGVAALLGYMLHQDAVGIFMDDDTDEPKHTFFKIFLQNQNNTTKDKMRIIHEIHAKYPMLSTQMSSDGKSVEAHDYTSEESQIEASDIARALDAHGQSCSVARSTAASVLVEKKQYEEAIIEGGFETHYLAIETVRQHQLLFS